MLLSKLLHHFVNKRIAFFMFFLRSISQGKFIEEKKRKNIQLNFKTIVSYFFFFFFNFSKIKD